MSGLSFHQLSFMELKHGSPCSNSWGTSVCLISDTCVVSLSSLVGRRLQWEGLLTYWATPLASIIHTRWLKFFGDIIQASLSVDHNWASEPASIHCPLMEPTSWILLSHSLWQLSLILHLLALDWQRLIVKLRIVKFGQATRWWWCGCVVMTQEITLHTLVHWQPYESFGMSERETSQNCPCAS